ncbi:MAG TPA: hypothetical protein VGX48_08960 [Pyrinomonadaceae bacterium]|jgi:hypothetical protein|nr:hypothetical protein [Pyrinomonadaceae bacterium]
MNNREQNLGRYLLGEMSDAERSELERAYFEDPRLFEQLVQAENELVDAYARELLPPERCERFERHYLTHPARRERARFARSLAAALESRGVPPAAAPARAEPFWRRLLGSLSRPKLAWAFSASLLLVCAVAVWFYTGAERRPREPAGAERATREPDGGESRRPVNDSGIETAREPEAVSAEKKKARPSPTPGAKAAPVVATLVLTAGGTRSAEAAPPAVLPLAASTEKVSLRLNLREADYRSYSAVLRRAGGGEVFSWRRVTPKAAKSGATITFAMPARRLTEGDYVLTLKGTGDAGEVEDVSVSLFSVERK